MKYALCLARKGYKTVFPNPPVGAVVVKNGKIIAAGYHKRSGGNHAEIEALQGLTQNQTRGSTMFVTLEPCKHLGLTPPCVDAILEAGLKRVVIGAKDHTLEAGGGASILKNVGLVVEYSKLSSVCEDFIEPWKRWAISRVKSVEILAVVSANGLLFRNSVCSDSDKLSADLPLGNQIKKIFLSLSRKVQAVEDNFEAVLESNSYHVLYSIFYSDYTPASIDGIISNSSDSLRLHKLNLIRVPYFMQKSDTWLEWGSASSLRSEFRLDDVSVSDELILERYTKL